MRQPESHYPPYAIQHTRIVLALTVLHGTLGLYQHNGNAFANPITDVEKAAISCRRDARMKSLSAGAKRALDNACQIMGPYFETSGLGKNKLFRQWAALLWASLVFVEDVLATCPAFVDKHPRKWGNLQSSLESLAEQACILASGNADEYGTMIYECGAWASENVYFKPDNRSDCNV